MKNLKSISAIFAVVVTTIFSSCSKDDAAVTPAPETPLLYRVKEVRDANNVVQYSFQYNAQNQKTKEILTDGREVSYLYNNSGQLVKVTDTGYINTPNYDGVTDYSYTNNLLTEEISTRPNRKDKVVYTYSGSNISTLTQYGFSTTTNSWSQSSGTFRYTYNANNQLVQLVQDDRYTVGVGGSLGRKLTYSYDDRGNQKETRAFGKETFESDMKLTYTQNFVYDAIKPVNYINSTLFVNNFLEQVYKEYNTSGVVTSTTTTVYRYDYTPEGNISKVYRNDVLNAINILEKIQ